MITLGIINMHLESKLLINKIINQMNPPANHGNHVHIDFEFGNLEIFGANHKKKEPQVLLLFLGSRDLRTIDLARNVFPNSQIVVISSYEDTKHLRECFKSGCVSYLRKSDLENYLYFTIITTANGGSFIDPNSCRILIEEEHERRRQEELLTVRELQIAKGIIDGLSYKLIASRHSISLDTVRVYVKRVYKKLKINSKGELFAHLTN